jgi:hypothetical protein
MHVNARPRQQVSLIDLTGPGGPINPPVKPGEGHDVEGRCHRSIVKAVGIKQTAALIPDPLVRRRHAQLLQLPVQRAAFHPDELRRPRNIAAETQQLRL